MLFDCRNTVSHEINSYLGMQATLSVDWRNEPSTTPILCRDQYYSFPFERLTSALHVRRPATLQLETLHTSAWKEIIPHISLSNMTAENILTIYTVLFSPIHCYPSLDTVGNTCIVNTSLYDNLIMNQELLQNFALLGYAYLTFE